MSARTIVVPLDASTHARCALPVASVLAELLDATLQLVHVTPEKTSASQMLERVGLGARDVRGWVVASRAGHPCEEIVAAARMLLDSPEQLVRQREELARIVELFKGRDAASGAADAIEEVALLGRR